MYVFLPSGAGGESQWSDYVQSVLKDAMLRGIAGISGLLSKTATNGLLSQAAFLVPSSGYSFLFMQWSGDWWFGMKHLATGSSCTGDVSRQGTVSLTVSLKESDRCDTSTGVSSLGWWLRSPWLLVITRSRYLVIRSWSRCLCLSDFFYRRLAV